jgi:hypothetical protein
MGALLSGSNHRDGMAKIWSQIAMMVLLQGIRGVGHVRNAYPCYYMSRWFTHESGNIQCQAITGCDFSTDEETRKYIERGCVSRCRRIAQ